MVAWKNDFYIVEARHFSLLPHTGGIIISFMVPLEFMKKWGRSVVTLRYFVEWDLQYLFELDCGPKEWWELLCRL